MTEWARLGVQRQQVLSLLMVVQALRGSQVARLTGRSYRMAMHHLEVLARRGLVEGVATAGGSKVWRASAAGLHLLSRLAGRPVAGLTSAKLAEHAAQVSEFLVRALEEQHRSAALCGVCFRTEAGLRPGLRCDALARVGWGPAPRPAGPGGLPLDGLVWNGHGGRPAGELLLALEVDRGTMTLVRLARKARLYGLYHAERWRWRQDHGAFPLPVVVTADPARAGAIWLRWKQVLRGQADWAVSCWEWLEGGIMGGRWLNADGSVSSLLEFGAAPPA